jgi:hypothetical protein
MTMERKRIVTTEQQLRIRLLKMELLMSFFDAQTKRRGVLSTNTLDAQGRWVKNED